MLTYTCMQDIDHGKGVSGIMDVAKKMFRQRRLAMKEKFQLKYVYEAILFYAQDILAKGRCNFKSFSGIQVLK